MSYTIKVLFSLPETSVLRMSSTSSESNLEHDPLIFLISNAAQTSDATNQTSELLSKIVRIGKTT